MTDRLEADLDLDLLRLFVAVIDGGSIAAAARALGVGRATVRRRLALLERHTGVALIRREGDALLPTPSGAALVRGARGILTEASALLVEAANIEAAPTGLVRIAIPPGPPPILAAMALRAIRSRWPLVRLGLIEAEHPHQLLAEHAELALSVAEPAPEGPWTAVDLIELRLGLQATASYLKRSGVPQVVADLAGHELLVWDPPEGGPPTLVGHDGTPVSLPVAPAYHSNNIHTLRQMALAGAGLAWLPDASLSALGEARGMLTPVLADRLGGRRWVRLLLPDAYRDVPRARAMADALVALVAQLRGPERGRGAGGDTRGVGAPEDVP